MSVQVARTEGIRVEFDEPSSWTLWLVKQNSDIRLTLHWNRGDRSSSETLIKEGTPEYGIFMDFFNAKAD